MKCRIVILVIMALIVLMTLACVGSGEVNGASSAVQDSSYSATATSAAGEFHVQLTLTAPTPLAASP